VAELQSVDVISLDQNDRVAFFLNTYHLLSIHSYLETGEPGDFALKRRSNSISACYDISGKIFSLIEIEHCILRAPMSRPEIFGSSFFLPSFSKKDSRQLFALQQPEPRINFVINCGSYSSPYYVWPLDGGDQLNQQLDHASAHFLQDQVFVNENKKTIGIPKICIWYAQDFGNKQEKMIQKNWKLFGCRSTWFIR